MSEYRIYNGGTGSLGYNAVPIRNASQKASTTTYAAGLKRNAYVIPFHVDLADHDWSMWLKDNNTTIATGDTIVSHILGAGSYVNRLVFFNRKAAPSGSTVTVSVRGAEVASAAAASDVDATTDAAAAADPASVTPGSTTVLVSNTIDLTTPGWKFINVDKFLADEGDVVIAVDGGNLDGACFTVSVDVDDYSSSHTCTCARVPCEYELGTPDCA